MDANNFVIVQKKIVKTYVGDDPVRGTCARLAWLGLVPPALPGLACGALWSTKLHTSNRSQNMDWVPCYHPNTARTATFFCSSNFFISPRVENSIVHALLFPFKTCWFTLLLTFSWQISLTSQCGSSALCAMCCAYMDCAYMCCADQAYCSMGTSGYLNHLRP